MTIDVTLVLPAHNEASRLKTCVDQSRFFLEGSGYSYEIIIAEDGSTDGTDRTASELSRRFPQVRHIHNSKRLGRGAALNVAFKHAKGRVTCYMDVDMATPVHYLRQLIGSIDVGYDVATGSRLLPQSVAHRRAMRKTASRSYNLAIRLLFRSQVHDHQCGFKAFSPRALSLLLDDVEARHWFWDTEILILAQRKGLKVKEFPISWNPPHDTKVNLVKDVLQMTLQAVRLWFKLNM